jgi:ABC-type Na+ efflux pump permease subunit
MTFLPVVERELRVAARRRSTYFARVAAVAVGLVATGWVMKEGGGRSSLGSGEDLFRILVALLFIYAGIFGTQVTADCMSEEKREGTLGLLFLTDLKGYDVVLGKLAATSLNAFYGMLALVPVLAIPLLMGGVSRGELLRVVLALVNILLFTLTIGVWASVLCRRAGRAHGLSLVVALLIMFAFPLAMIMFSWPLVTQIKGVSVQNLVLADLSSPACGCALAFDELYKGDQRAYFWFNAVATQFYSWIFFGMACCLAPRSWQDAVVSKSSWWTGRGFSSAQRSKLIEINPFLWRASRPGIKQMAVWFVLCILAAICVWLRWLDVRSSGAGAFFGDPVVDIGCLIAAGWILKWWIALEAGRALAEDRRSGALELLLSTPLAPKEILRGQTKALWRQFAWPIAALLAVNAGLLLPELRAMPRLGWTKDDRTTIISAHAIIGVFLTLDSIALSWLGMRFGFFARRLVRAAALAMLCVVVLPALLFLLVGYLFLASGATLNALPTFMLWCVLGYGADVVAVFAREKLLSEFRVIASEGHKRGRAKETGFAGAPKLAEVS